MVELTAKIIPPTSNFVPWSLTHLHCMFSMPFHCQKKPRERFSKSVASFRGLLTQLMWWKTW